MLVSSVTVIRDAGTIVARTLDELAKTGFRMGSAGIAQLVRAADL